MVYPQLPIFLFCFGSRRGSEINSPCRQPRARMSFYHSPRAYPFPAMRVNMCACEILVPSHFSRILNHTHTVTMAACSNGHRVAALLTVEGVLVSVFIQNTNVLSSLGWKAMSLSGQTTTVMDPTTIELRRGLLQLLRRRPIRNPATTRKTAIVDTGSHSLLYGLSMQGMSQLWPFAS